MASELEHYGIKGMKWGVRLLFDPPTNSFLVKSLDEQIKELEWRINVHREEEAWTEPTSS